MQRVARHVLVRGCVQGVGFRWSTQREAERLGLDGWVRNRADGRVEVHVEGAGDDVDRLVGWLRTGPPSARVDALEERDDEVLGGAGFEVRPTA